jgi:F0F1-type ATP synthase delta subunit
VKQFGADLTFTFRVDPALLGGLRVRVGDSLMDTSVASRLTALRESLTSAVR